MLLQQWWYHDDSDAENRTYEQTIRKFEIVFESIHWLCCLLNFWREFCDMHVLKSAQKRKDLLNICKILSS